MFQTRSPNFARAFQQSEATTLCLLVKWYDVSQHLSKPAFSETPPFATDHPRSGDLSLTDFWVP